MAEQRYDDGAVITIIILAPCFFPFHFLFSCEQKDLGMGRGSRVRHWQSMIGMGCLLGLKNALIIIVTERKEKDLE